jgi:hypothetical protein
MSRFWRNALCIFIAVIFALVGLDLFFIFWPLLFPQALHRSSWGEDFAPVAGIASFLLSGAFGFFLTRRLTRRYVRDQDDVAVLFPEQH